MANNLIISEFIEEYQKHPCLWNKSIEEYRNRVKREHAEELLLKFSKILTIKELRRKIRSIRCTYNQEVAKIKKSMVTGSCTNTVYKPKLAWFSLADSFLKKNHLNDNNVGANLILTSKKNSNLVEKCQENHENICHSLDISILGPEHSENIVSIATELPKNMNKRVSKLQPQKKTVKKCKLLNTLDNAVDALTFICTQQTSTENEFTIFGKQVGLQLQKLPLKEALELQNDIQQLLTRARLVSIKDINVPKTI